MADQVHTPIEELIKIVMKSSRPLLHDLLATHTFRGFKELKTIGDNYEQTRMILAPPMIQNSNKVVFILEKSQG
jgi:hypothetical protein